MEEKEIINQDQEQSNQEPQVDTSIEIQKPTAETRPYSEVVEEERAKVLSQNKLSSRLSTISIICVLALSIAGIFLLNIAPIVAYVLMGVAVATLIVFSIVIRRIARPDVQGYIVKASTAINEFTFADGRFTQVKYDPTDKLQLEDVSSDGAFSDLIRVASRNVVEGLFEERSFKVCETAFFKLTGKKQTPVFIGKYLSAVNDLHFEGRIILISKGDTDADIPDGIDDLKQVDFDNKFFAYAPNENTYKVLDKKFIKAIKDINVNKHLMNLTVIIWAGRTIVYASYDDPTITLPFYEKYQADTAVDYRNNLIQLLQAIQLLNKE